MFLFSISLFSFSLKHFFSFLVWVEWFFSQLILVSLWVLLSYFNTLFDFIHERNRERERFESDGRTSSNRTEREREREREKSQWKSKLKLEMEINESFEGQWKKTSLYSQWLVFFNFLPSSFFLLLDLFLGPYQGP